MAAPHELKGHFRTLKSFVHTEAMAREKYLRDQPAKLERKRTEIADVRYAIERLAEMPAAADIHIAEIERMLREEREFRSKCLKGNPKWQRKKLEEVAGAERALRTIQEYWKQHFPEMQRLPQAWGSGF